MSFIDRLFYVLGHSQDVGPRRYELDEHLQTVLEDLALQEQRPMEDVHADLISSALAHRHRSNILWDHWRSLSPREQDVTALTCQVCTNPQIAARLHISVETVKMHMRNTLVKFQLYSKSELRLISHNWGLGTLMDTLIEPKTGGWILLAGACSMNSTMLTAIAHLGERGAVRVLDGGNRFNAYTVARAAHGRPDILERITVSRAFTCYQMLSLLESTPAIPAPFVVLDLLNTFYDESVQAGERKRLLQACISHLHRLGQAAGGVVSIRPPAVPSQAALEMLDLLQSSAVDTFFVQMAAPAPEPMRLF